MANAAPANEQWPLRVAEGQRMAEQGADKPLLDVWFANDKLGTARFYFARLLPRIDSLSASVKAGSESLYLLDAEQF